MLTDAETNQREREGDANICAKSVWCGNSGETKDINPDLWQCQIKQEIHEAVNKAIRKIDVKVKEQKLCRTRYGWIAFILLCLIVICVCIWFTKKINNSYYKDCKTDINALHSTLGGVIFWIIVVVLFIILCFCVYRYSTLKDEKKACKNLIESIRKEKKSTIKNIEIATAKAVVKVDFLLMEKEIKEAAEDGIFDQLEKLQELEDVRQKKYQEIEENEVVRQKTFKEFQENDIMRQTQFGEEIKKIQVVKEEKVSEVEIKYNQFIKEKQKFMESARREEKNRREREEKNRRERDGKNDDREESPLAKIDVNLFIYAMVFVFALFVICTICNFKEEERTGEIIEV